VAQVREIQKRFVIAPSSLTKRVSSISLMQLKAHLKNKHNRDLAVTSPSKHLGLYRYNVNIQRNTNLANFSISTAAHFSGFENIDDTPSRDLLGV
jgi:hypothetical protein